MLSRGIFIIPSPAPASLISRNFPCVVLLTVKCTKPAVPVASWACEFPRNLEVVHFLAAVPTASKFYPSAGTWPHHIRGSVVPKRKVGRTANMFVFPADFWLTWRVAQWSNIRVPRSINRMTDTGEFLLACRRLRESWWWDHFFVFFIS